MAFKTEPLAQQRSQAQDERELVISCFHSYKSFVLAQGREESGYIE